MKDIPLTPGKEPEYVRACMDALKKQEVPFVPKTEFSETVQKYRDQVCTVGEFLFVLQELKKTASAHNSFLQSLDEAKKLPVRNAANLPAFVKSLRNPFDGGMQIHYAGEKAKALAVIDPIIDLRKFGHTLTPITLASAPKTSYSSGSSGNPTVTYVPVPTTTNPK